jgi:hypothetical protein
MIGAKSVQLGRPAWSVTFEFVTAVVLNHFDARTLSSAQSQLVCLLRLLYSKKVRHVALTSCSMPLQRSAWVSDDRTADALQSFRSVLQVGHKNLNIMSLLRCFHESQHS